MAMTAYIPDVSEASRPETPAGSIVLGYLRALVAARDCAAAVEAGRRPGDESLRTLGIDPVAFAEVKLF
jgi:hypothetical protein